MSQQEEGPRGGIPLGFSVFIGSLEGKTGDFLDGKDILENEFHFRIEGHAAEHVSRVLPRLKQSIVNGFAGEQLLPEIERLDRLTRKMEIAYLAYPGRHLPMVGLSVEDAKLLKRSAEDVLPDHSFAERKLYRKTVGSILKPFYHELEHAGDTQAIEEIWPKRKKKSMRDGFWLFI